MWASVPRKQAKDKRGSKSLQTHKEKNTQDKMRFKWLGVVERKYVLFHETSKSFGNIDTY